MLLMFALGGANLGWMLVLGAVVAVERVSLWGRRLIAPLGVALIVWALAQWTGIAKSAVGRPVRLSTSRAKGSLV